MKKLILSLLAVAVGLFYAVIAMAAPGVRMELFEKPGFSLMAIAPG